MSNIQEDNPRNSSNTAVRNYHDLVSQLQNSGHQNMDMQALIAKLIPLLDKRGGGGAFQNGIGSNDVIDRVKKLDDSILGPLVNMVQCLQQQETQRATDNSKNYNTSGHDNRPVSNDRSSNWIAGSRPTDELARLDNNCPLNSVNGKPVSYQGNDRYPGGNIGDENVGASVAPTVNNTFSPNSQLSPVNVICSPDHQKPSFRNSDLSQQMSSPRSDFSQQISPNNSDFQSQISPQMDTMSPDGGRSATQHRPFMGTAPGENRRNPLFDPEKIKKLSNRSDQSVKSRKLESLLASDMYSNTPPDYDSKCT